MDEQIEFNFDEPLNEPEKTEEPVPNFNIGDMVKVITTVKDVSDIESEAYFNKFENKIGEITRINDNHKITCYEVDFNKTGREGTGVFYVSDIDKI